MFEINNNLMLNYPKSKRDFIHVSSLSGGPHRPKQMRSHDKGLSFAEKNFRLLLARHVSHSAINGQIPAVF